MDLAKSVVRNTPNITNELFVAKYELNLIFALSVYPPEIVKHKMWI